ncbi:hypothetical protein PTSG_01722 [Salpingoeca rosetta]|uniref:PDZ domain-containing protein n=1 Tax=Salpingoeca rosetta (strain ATCC 50818 / BSB-021) TaxID=946362 RepID=F2TYR9_SALR5|nr:uncharacterized protein PTSG_01722 [Salpingoeca rosetta]EGD78743.1 hypothetical protein PTSG_01722 [Salpingoeca rosetta]|eukprot:XP_004997700.1 hypothetical protein PTSG_01722 [Salpingoeca rosetta]
MGNKQSSVSISARNSAGEDAVPAGRLSTSSKQRASALLSLPNTSATSSVRQSVDSNAHEGAPSSNTTSDCGGAVQESSQPQSPSATTTHSSQQPTHEGPANTEQSKAATNGDAPPILLAGYEPLYPNDNEVLPVVLDRDESGFGFTFVGPADSEGMTGLYITRVKPNTPAAESNLLMRAQQILAVNGEDVLLASKFDVQNMLRQCDTVLLEVKYDAEGFAVYDQGEELRRISFMVFADAEAEDGENEIQTFSARYLGHASIQDARLESMHAVYKQLRKKPEKNHKTKLLLGVGVMDIRVFPARGNPSPDLARRHLLIDVLNCVASSNVLALVSNDLVVNSHRQKTCYIYTLKNKKEAARAADVISARCNAGFSRVQRELSRQRQRTQSMHMTREKRLSIRRNSMRTRAATTSTAQRKASTTSTGAPAGPKTGSLRGGGVLDFRKTPLQEQRWYFASMTQTDAIRVLVERAPAGGFLVFPSGPPQEYEVCVKEGARDIRSMKMIPHVEEDSQIYYTLEGHEMLFRSVVLLVWYFGHHPYAHSEDGQPLMFRLPRRRKSKTQQKDVDRPRSHISKEIPATKKRASGTADASGDAPAQQQAASTAGTATQSTHILEPETQHHQQQQDQQQQQQQQQAQVHGGEEGAAEVSPRTESQQERAAQGEDGETLQREGQVAKDHAEQDAATTSPAQQQEETTEAVNVEVEEEGAREPRDVEHESGEKGNEETAKVSDDGGAGSVNEEEERKEKGEREKEEKERKEKEKEEREKKEKEEREKKEKEERERKEKEERERKEKEERERKQKEEREKKEKEEREKKEKEERERKEKEEREKKEKEERERKEKEERERKEKEERERKEKEEQVRQERETKREKEKEEQQDKQEHDASATSSVPLRRTSDEEYAMSERERQLRDLDEEATRTRLSSISFDFTFN